MRRFTKTNQDFSIPFGNTKTLDDVYTSYSDRKRRAYKACQDLEYELSGITPFGSVLSANSQTFTYGFISAIKAVEVLDSRTGEVIFQVEDFDEVDERTGLLAHNIFGNFKITACYDYCTLHDIGERGIGLIKIPAHCYARVISKNGVEYIVE